MSASPSRVCRAAALVAGITLLATLALGMGPLRLEARAAYTATSLTSFDSRLLHLVNHARVNHGLRRLTPAAGTTDVAHGWACRQAGARTLQHNPDLARQLATHGSALWTSYAENVGVQTTNSGARHLFRLYMRSPEHRANILDRSVRFVGIWSKRAGGLRFNTIDFVGDRSSAYNDGYGYERTTC